MTDTPNIPFVIENEEGGFAGVPSNVAIAKHPLHPAMVTFPIAFLVGAAGTDLAYWLTNSDLFWARASFWLLVAGLASGVLAALVGMVDFLKIPIVRKRSAGWAHMILNVAALGLTIVNLALRWSDPAKAVLPVGLVISVIVATLLGLSGWYGGELVYRHRVAVIPTRSETRP
jgi:uncharacterized membrane protein